MKRTWSDPTHPGAAIVIAMTLLIALGILTIYVTDTHYSPGHDGPKNAAKQCMHVLVGGVAVLLILRAGYLRIARYAYVIFLVALLVLLLPALARLTHSTFGGLVTPRNGAYRWIQLPGFQLQPSEFMKIALVLALSWYLRYRSNYRRLAGLLMPFAISLVPLALILLEPDLGTVVLLLPVLLAMLFLAGAKLLHLGMIVLLGLAVVPLAWGQIQGYQRARVTAVFLQSESLRQAVIDNPQRYKSLVTRRQALEWAASSGYQLIHSKNAIGSGGVGGHGWGQGIYVQSGLLPDRHNDFVFALIGHQWGFLGCILVLGCYSVLVVAGARIAEATPEPLGRLLAGGITALIATQALINVAMTVGLMPITGITLPFVSYGGSSMLTNFICVALLLSVSRHRPFLLSAKPFQFRPTESQKTPLVECGVMSPADSSRPQRVSS